MTGSSIWNPEISPPTPSPDSWVTDGVYFRSDAQGIHLHLPSTLPWEELWENLVWQLRSRKPYWAGVAPLTLWSQQRELDMPTLTTSCCPIVPAWTATVARSNSIPLDSDCSGDVGLFCGAIFPFGGSSPCSPRHHTSVPTFDGALWHVRASQGLGIPVGGSQPRRRDHCWRRYLGLGTLAGPGSRGGRRRQGSCNFGFAVGAHSVAHCRSSGPSARRWILPNTPEVVYLQEDVICVASLQDFLRRGV
jgi:septum site-determining protein MinC